MRSGSWASCRCATALVGFSQGAIVALEIAQAHPDLVGRVVVFGGRYATLPSASPRAVIHMVHGKDDATVPARLAVEAATTGWWRSVPT